MMALMDLEDFVQHIVNVVLMLKSVSIIHQKNNLNLVMVLVELHVLKVGYVINADSILLHELS